MSSPTGTDRVDTTDLKWQRRRDSRLLGLTPWLVSVVMHLGLVLLAVFVVWSVTVRQPEHRPPQLVINPSLPPVTPLRSTLDEAWTRSHAARNVRPGVVERDARLDPLVRPAVLPTPAEGLRPAWNLGPLGGLHDQDGTRFFGIEATPGKGAGRVKRLVYLIDASGSLLDTLPFVMEELRRSIRKIKGRQLFTILFFGASEVTEVPPVGLKPADELTKRLVCEWIGPGQGNVVPTGGSDPLDAMKRAFGYRPDVVYLLSDNITGSGRHALSQQRLLKSIERMNHDRVPINTIQFVYEDPLVDVGLRRTLALISERSGGNHKFVDAMEVGVR